MRRSKLEMYVDILEALARHGPSKITHIMYNVNISCSFLKPKYMNFLIQLNLVEEQKLHQKKVVYVITERGLTVLKWFRELKSALGAYEEAQKTQALLH